MGHGGQAIEDDHRGRVAARPRGWRSRRRPAGGRTRPSPGRRRRAGPPPEPGAGRRRPRRQRREWSWPRAARTASRGGGARIRARRIEQDRQVTAHLGIPASRQKADQGLALAASPARAALRSRAGSTSSTGCPTNSTGTPASWYRPTSNGKIARTRLTSRAIARSRPRAPRPHLRGRRNTPRAPRAAARSGPAAC